MLGLIGLTCVAFALLYKQDQTSSKKWYEILQQNVGVRVTFGVLGLTFLSWAGWIQFRM